MGGVIAVIILIGVTAIIGILIYHKRNDSSNMGLHSEYERLQRIEKKVNVIYRFVWLYFTLAILSLIISIINGFTDGFISALANR